MVSVTTRLFNRFGEEVSTKIELSDRLFELALKKANPEFRERLQVDTVVSGGVLVVAAPALTASDWQQRVEAQIVSSPKTIEPPSPSEPVIDASVVDPGIKCLTTPLPAPDDVGGEQ